MDITTLSDCPQSPRLDLPKQTVPGGSYTYEPISFFKKCHRVHLDVRLKNLNLLKKRGLSQCNKAQLTSSKWMPTEIKIRRILSRIGRVKINTKVVAVAGRHNISPSLYAQKPNTEPSIFGNWYSNGGIKRSYYCTKWLIKYPIYSYWQKSCSSMLIWFWFVELSPEIFHTWSR